ncbi:MAG: GxxExxY protein [Candidatus Marinimicrobia bacterium]|nr:GxxExxY protein [Candidatus Neomarinimicrobiota bacterium]
MKTLLYKEEVYTIVGAAMEVHRELKSGFLESVYEEALRLEFDEQNIPYKNQVQLKIHYKGNVLEKKFRADFLCYDQIVLDIKHQKSLTDIDTAQILNYLRITEKRVGLLINFGNIQKLEWKRFVN